jgi:hypothetical protein
MSTGLLLLLLPNRCLSNAMVKIYSNSDGNAPLNRVGAKAEADAAKTARIAVLVYMV